MKYVSLEKNERTAWVAMNRPEAMNSLTAELCAELVEAFAECERDDEIRAVVLTGSGRAFCAGGDLPTLAALKSREEAEEYVKTAGRVALAVVRSAKPYIAMVNGAAAGAGFNIALACDFLCASKNAKFTQAFSSIGLIADCGGNFLLPRLAGPREAKRLMMLPEKLTAEDAEKLGLTTLVAEDAELREKTAKLAARHAAARARRNKKIHQRSGALRSRAPPRRIHPVPPDTGRRMQRRNNRLLRKTPAEILAAAKTAAPVDLRRDLRHT